MSFKQPYTVGLGNVGSYQVAGSPYLTGALGHNAAETRKIEFQQVTSRIVVRRIDGNGSAGDLTKALDVSFTHPDLGATDSGCHLWHLMKEGDEVEMRVKCTELYLTTNASAAASWQLYAELTNIPAASMYALTGSGLTE
tara:strand:+ start:520 stop:939 length:420 start_codon:yes stop_codon:yes gene_type:complete